jgi:hypothetical protein
MEITLDFIIDERNCEEASFDYYLNELLNIYYVTLSVLSYNSWWTGDFLDPSVILLTQIK